MRLEAMRSAWAERVKSGSGTNLRVIRCRLLDGLIIQRGLITDSGVEMAPANLSQNLIPFSFAGIPSDGLPLVAENIGKGIAGLKRNSDAKHLIFGGFYTTGIEVFRRGHSSPLG